MQPALIGRAVHHHLGDHAAGHPVHIEGFRQRRRDVLHRDTEIAPDHPAVFDQVRHHLAGDGRGRGEADALPAAGGGKDRRVDANQVTARIDQRATGVTAVNGGVGLNEVFERSDAQMTAAGGTDNAHGHGLAHAQRIADGQHHIADGDLIRTVQLDFRQILQGDLQQRQVGLRIRADHPGGSIPAVAQRHQDLVGVPDHVITGEDIAVVGDDHTGTQAGQGALPARLFHEAVEQRILGNGAGGDDLRGVDIHHRRRRPVDRAGVAVRAGSALAARRARPLLVPPEHPEPHQQTGEHR